MKLTTTQLLLAGAGMTTALPHMDSPRQRLLNGLEMPAKFLGGGTLHQSRASKNETDDPYTPGYRDPYDNAIDAEGKELDPLPWRNGLGASVLGPWNPDRSRQDPDLVRPPSTDKGNMANMRWSFADSHIRIEVFLPRCHDGVTDRGGKC